MNTYLTYLAETTVCMAVLFLFYYLAMRDLTFYRVRRFFLLSAVVLSLLIPAIEIRVMDTPIIEPVTATGSFVRQRLNQGGWGTRDHEIIAHDQRIPDVDTVAPVDYRVILLLIYLAGCLVFAFRLAASLISILRIRHKAKREQYGTRVLYIHPLADPAFSFARYIFVHPEIGKDGPGKAMVVQHECCHVQHGHTYDILFVELVKIVFWFNPVIHVIKKELLAVHEFFADRKVVIGASKEKYSNLLISHTRTEYKTDMDLTHAFVGIPLKRRIVQLFKEPSANWKLSKLLMTLPVAGSLFLTFSCASEFDIQTSLPSGEKVRSIKVRYHDEFGDMPQYDGKYYSSVEFDRRGKIIDLKKGTFYDNIFDKERTAISYSEYSLDNIVWLLDYGYYTHNGEYIAFGAENWVNHRMSQLDKFNHHGLLNVNRNAFGQLLNVSYEVNTENYEVSHFFSFAYDPENRLESMVETTTFLSPVNNIERSNSTVTRSFRHNPLGQLIYIKQDDSQIDIFYNAEGKVEEVIVYENEAMMRRFDYTYNDLGLRATSVGYNKENKKEFTLAFDYLFF